MLKIASIDVKSNQNLYASIYIGFTFGINDAYKNKIL